MGAELALADALRIRWRATGLPTRTPGAAAVTAAEQVRRLGAVQAQDYESTLWSLGRRTGETRSAIVGQFAAGELVRTHALRQTWHFVHRDDLRLVQAATAARVQQRNAEHYRQHDLDDATLRAAGQTVVAALAAGPLTRAQLAGRLAEAGIRASGPRLGMIMMWAELECLVASGPPAGRQHTYAAWDAGRMPDVEESTTELVRRFLASHGPASLDDLLAWATLSRTQLRRALADLPVERARVGDVECLWLGDLDDDAWASPQVELLNGYDEYVSGLSAAGKRWLDRGGLARQRRGTPIGLVLVDGQLAGNWRRAATGATTVLDVLLLRRFTDAELAALERNAEDYGRFLGATVRVNTRQAG